MHQAGRHSGIGRAAAATSPSRRVSTTSPPTAGGILQTAGGLALESLGSTAAADADLAMVKLALSAVLVYSALYLWERALWSLTSAAEQKLKCQYVEFALKEMAAMEEPLVEGIRQQVRQRGAAPIPISTLVDGVVLHVGWIST